MFVKGDIIQIKNKYIDAHPNYKGKTYKVMEIEADHKDSASKSVIAVEVGTENMYRLYGEYFEKV